MRRLSSSGIGQRELMLQAVDIYRVARTLFVLVRRTCARGRYSYTWMMHAEKFSHCVVLAPRAWAFERSPRPAHSTPRACRKPRRYTAGRCNRRVRSSSPGTCDGSCGRIARPTVGAEGIGGGACGQLGSLEAHHESDCLVEGGHAIRRCDLSKGEEGWIGVHVAS